MKRVLFFVYGVVAYTLGVATLVYLIAFIGDFSIAPKTIDGVATGGIWQSILINVLLIALFGIQHSTMARPWFKEQWTKVVPEPIERSTYVLFTFLALGNLMFFWQPLGGTVWTVAPGTVLYSLLYAFFFAGWGILLLATFLINHFDLFGLRQVWLYLMKKPYTKLVFKERAFYKSVRHPIYSGLLLGFWCTPNMTVSHLFLAGLWTFYIFYAITLEERDLLNQWGNKYREYMSRTGSVIPRFKKKTATKTNSVHEHSNA